MQDAPRGPRGLITRADLTGMVDFFAPREANAPPPFSSALARLSAELSANVYHLRLGRWLAAGWSDCTLQVENRVLTGVRGAPEPGLRPVRRLRTGLVLTRARSMIHPLRNPIGDVLRAVRQLWATDTGKAAVMARAQGGRAVVAICFMGTGRKFYDWLTNCKLTHREGLHEGFLQLARQFDGNADRIPFPDLDAALGEAALTLEDVLREAARPDSRFTLWLCGHSQGGAVCQTYAHLLLCERGVLPQNLLGYTFAAPTVAGPHWQGDARAYPLHHILNADDFVPRVGAQRRLGTDWIFYPDDGFRVRHYGYDPADTARAYARERLRRLLSHVTDTPAMLQTTLALLQAMEALDGCADAVSLFTQTHALLRRLRPAMAGLGLTFDALARPLAHRLRVLYRAVTDAPPDEDAIRALQEAFLRYISEVGAPAFSACMGELLLAPHPILRPVRAALPGALSPYSAIARWHLRELTSPQ
ncbi:MAG: hypothetical protein LBU67_02210 [Oscillospiraceae bacterium]|nr:hypothetical protein [Oscillospiraceae bacterium]